MVNKKILEEEIEAILGYLNQRKSLEAKKILKNLEDSKEEELSEFKEKIKRLVRNMGKSTHIPVSEIKEILNN